MKKEINSSGKNGVIIIEGHVQGLANTRALGKEGIPVVVVDKDNCIARYSKYCTSYFRCPDYRTDEFAYFLKDLAKNEGLSGWSLIPSNDHAVYTLSRFRRMLSEHFKLITPEIGIIDNIYKKHRLLSIAKKIGVPIPLTWNLSAVEEVNKFDFSYPVMIKGREGLTFYKATGKKVFLAENKSDLLAILHQLPDLIKVSDVFIQEIIPTDLSNKTISFTAFCIDGEIQTHWTGVKLREHPVKFGTSTFSESIINEEVKKLSALLLRELEYTGVCEVEFLKDNRTQEYKLIEINARTWLWVGLAIACGINYPLIIHNYLNNIPNNYPDKYKLNAQWMNRLTDSVFSVKSILSGQLPLSSYLKSLKGKKNHAIYSSTDYLPSIMFFILLPYLALKR